MRSQCRKIDLALSYQCGHAGASFRGRNRNTVNIRLPYARKRTDGFRDFECRDVLAFPAKGIADPIDEIEVAFVVLPHQVTGAEPGISRLEYIAKNLSIRRFLAGVAVETAARVRRTRRDLADCFSDFARSAADARSLLITDRLFLFEINLDQSGRESMREKRRNAPNDSRLAFDIEERKIAF